MTASRRERLLWVVFFLLLALPALIPALTQDIGALAYDAATEHIYRGVVFSEAISDGVLYPRWVQHLHLGLGSPLFTFQPPLPYYGMDVLYRLGLPHPLGWRVLIAGALLAAYGGMYLLVRDLTGRRWAGLVAGIAYLYAPYVLRNTLERGSNEAFSMALYPLVLWSLLWVARQPTAGRFIGATLVWAACIASHVLGPLMLFPFALVFATWLGWRRRTWMPLGALLAGGLLTAGIWAPMIPEQAWVHVERDFTQTDAIPAQNPIPLDALLAPPPVYDVARDNNRIGDRIGVLPTLGLVVALAGVAWAWRKDRRALHLRLAAGLLLCAATGLALLWLFTGSSDGVWRVGAPVLGRLLYRTRLMGVQALAAAGALGLLVALLPLRRQRAVSLVLIALLVSAALPVLYVELQHRWTTYSLPVDLAQVREAEIRSGGSALTAFSEFTPRWRTDPFDEAFVTVQGADFDAERTPLAEPHDGTSVLSTQVRDGAWDLAMRADVGTTATLNLLYYPRWAATLDGRPAALTPQSGTGLAQVALPAGEHTLALRYRATATESLGLAVSGLTALVLVAVALWGLRPRSGSPRRVGWRPSQEEWAGAPQEAMPPIWLLAGVTLALIVKILVIDPQTTWLRCVSTPDRVCGATATVDVPFASGHRLRGYAVTPERVGSGEVLRVELYWQAEADTKDALQSFVHVRNSTPDWPQNPRTGNEIWAQDEHVTPGGFPSTEYVPGKLYEDTFRVRLPEDMPPGEYRLEVGWFDPATGEQLDPVADAVQPPLGILWRSVLLPPVQVK